MLAQAEKEPLENIEGLKRELENPNPVVQGRALKKIIALPKVQDPKIDELRKLVPFCTPLLRHAVPHIRRDAAKVIGLAVDTVFADDLLEGLNDEEPIVRASAAGAFGYWARHGLKEPRAVRPLINLLSDKDPHVRIEAIDSLLQFRDQKAVDPLIVKLNDPSDEVRARAAATLGWMGDKKAAAPLILKLTDPVHDVRVSATYALGHLGDRRAITPLRKLVRSEEDAEWGYALILRSQLGDQDVLRDAAAALKTKHDPFWRRHIAYVLGEVGGPKAIPYLIQMLNEGSFVCEAAAEALGKIGDARAVQPLTRLLTDPDIYKEPDSGKAAKNALIAIGDLRASTALQEYEKGRWLPDLYRSAAKRAQKEGRYADAVASYQELSRIAPQDYSPSLKLAGLYHTLGELGKAEEYYKKSMAICPDCDGLAAKKALAELEIQKRTPTQPITFLGLGERPPPGLEKGFFIALSSFLFEGLRKNGLDVRIPDVREAGYKEGFNLDRAECSEAACTAEIAGAFGYKAGLYTKIEEIKKSGEWVMTLYYVEAQNAAVIHQTSIKIPKGDLKNADDGKNLAEKLAGEMAKELRKGRN